MTRHIEVINNIPIHACLTRSIIILSSSIGFHSAFRKRWGNNIDNIWTGPMCWPWICAHIYFVLGICWASFNIKLAFSIIARRSFRAYNFLAFINTITSFTKLRVFAVRIYSTVWSSCYTFTWNASRTDRASYFTTKVNTLAFLTSETLFTSYADTFINTFILYTIFKVLTIILLLTVWVYCFACSINTGCPWRAKDISTRININAITLLTYMSWRASYTSAFINTLSI